MSLASPGYVRGIETEGKLAPMKRSTHMQRIATAVAMLTLTAGVASAQPGTGGASCAVLEIDASNTSAPSVDPALGAQLERKLKKPPFSSWNTFKVLGTQNRALAPKKSETLALKQGQLGLLLRAVEKPRVRLDIVLDDQDGKRVLDTKVAVDAGDWMAVGRSLKGNHGQIIAFRCTLN